MATVKALRLFLLAAMVSLIVGCASGPALTGTAYSVTYRPSEDDANAISALKQAASTVVRRPTVRRTNPAEPVTARTLYLVDARNGTPLSTANYDLGSKAYFFKLPPSVSGPVDRSICLSFKNVAGVTIPLRKESAGDDGYDFRNPLWESEIRRAGTARALKTQLGAEEDAQVLAKAEIDAIERKHGADVANGTRPCTAAAAPSIPERPEAALDEDQARRAAPGVCALKWEGLLGEVAGSLFKDAGQAQDWEGRQGARALTAAMSGVSLTIAAEEQALLKSAAEGGPRVLQHQKGVQLFADAQSACRKQVERTAAERTAAWAERVKSLESAPARARERCEADVRQMQALRKRLAESSARRQDLAAQLAALEGKSSATASENLLDKTCAP